MNSDECGKKNLPIIISMLGFVTSRAKYNMRENNKGAPADFGRTLMIIASAWMM